MKAVVFHALGDIRLDSVADPKIQEPTDAIVRLTSSAICGTDLHMVRPQAGPAKQAAKAQSQEFDEEVKQVAPEQHPDGANWHPGDAPSQVLTWAVAAVRKAGTLAIIGVYPPTAKAFPIGAAMNKNLSLRSGNCHHRKYLWDAVSWVKTGRLSPERVLTQLAPVSAAIEAYEAFDRREEGWLKVELVPGHAGSTVQTIRGDAASSATANSAELAGQR